MLIRTYPVSLESLEPRVAPAAFVDATTVTYTDPEGDLVTVASSHPIFDSALTGFTFAPSGVGEQLQALVLGHNAAKASLSFTAAMQGVTGDGHVNVGRISATSGGGTDLGAATIDGDLGQIDVGDMSIKTPGLRSLTVLSLGSEGLASQGGGGDLVSTITGSLGKLTVLADVVGAEIVTAGGAAANIGPVFIGGSLIGGAVVADSGAIVSAGNIGPVTIHGSIVGGGADDSGRVESQGTLGRTSIAGSVIGGAGDHSGALTCVEKSGTFTLGGEVRGGDGIQSGNVYLGKATKITVNGSIHGGPGQISGQVGCASAKSILVGGDITGGATQSSGRLLTGKAGSVYVGGSVTGTSADNTGVIFGTDIRSLAVIGDLVGGDIFGAVSIHNSGYIQAESLGNVFIGGSVHAGVDMSTGTLQHSGAILAESFIRNLRIEGNLTGNETNPALISARGVPRAADVAIGKLTVVGDATYARVVAGYDASDAPVNPNAQINVVTIGGDWTASDLAAGIDAGLDGEFGTDDDGVIAGGSPAGKDSQIARVVVGGRILGTLAPSDRFGIESQQIGSILVGFSSSIPLTAGLDDLDISNATGSDVRVREFA
jgi:hypothetical protein